MKNERGTRRVIGIDPGLASTGWGIVEAVDGRYQYIAHGVITTASGLSHQQRLLIIHTELEAILELWKPGEAGMETLYFAKNVSSAMAVAEARGVATLTLARRAIPLGEYRPQGIKQAVVGFARAEKHQVQDAVRLLLGLREIPKPDHSADALAAALTRINTAVLAMPS